MFRSGRPADVHKVGRIAERFYNVYYRFKDDSWPLYLTSSVIDEIHGISRKLTYPSLVFSISLSFQSSTFDSQHRANVDFSGVKLSRISSCKWVYRVSENEPIVESSFLTTDSHVRKFSQMDFYLDWIISERSNTSSRVHPFSRRLPQRTGIHRPFYSQIILIIIRVQNNRASPSFECEQSLMRDRSFAEFGASIQFVGQLLGGLNKFTLTRFAGGLAAEMPDLDRANRLNCD